MNKKILLLTFGMLILPPVTKSNIPCMFNPPYNGNYEMSREYFMMETLAITGRPSTRLDWCSTKGGYARGSTLNNTNWNPHACSPVEFGLMTLTVFVDVQAPTPNQKGKGWSYCPLNNNN